MEIEVSQSDNSDNDAIKETLRESVKEAACKLMNHTGAWRHSMFCKDGMEIEITKSFPTPEEEQNDE